MTDASSENKKTLPIEEIARYPLPGMAVPGSLAFSSDDRLITYLYSPEKNLTNQLFAFDPLKDEYFPLVVPQGGGNTEENLSLEEKLQRERQRQRALGLTQYAWSNWGDHILIPLQREIYVKENLDSPLKKVVERHGSPALSPQFSPDGKWIAYVQEAELYVVLTLGGEPRQLTSGARGAGKTHGLAEFIAQEEMYRQQGFWWSPDSRSIAFEEVDETHIPVYRIVHQGKDQVGEGAQEDHRYPFAGQPNARVRLGVISIEGGEPAWMDLGDEEDIYLARAGWFPDGRLWAQIENREQTELDVVSFHPSTGVRTTLFCEKSDIWVNLHDMLKPLNSGGFIWASERTGYRHLYLYDEQARLVRPLTQGDWMVDALAGVDQDNRIAYFTSTKESPLESHLYAVSFDEGEPRRLTSARGTHAIVLDHACQRFIDTFSSLDTPPAITLCDLSDGDVLATVYDQPDARVQELNLQPPELVTLKNRNGDTLYGAVYRPTAEFGPGPYPTIVSVYGGPHVQVVTDSWPMTVNMRAQYLRSLGFLIFMLDNRGSARRGLQFEAAVKHDMSHLEVKDQVDGVQWLASQGLADPKRVGVYGWSYGGYMTLMCLARAPQVFKVGVAGAPTTAWDGYDTHYTERYMGTPQSNPEGYKNGAVMSHVQNITGKLLIVHGLIDENVHFRHTARLINALIKARKPYELMLFPDERHMPRAMEDRVYMEERIRDFFFENL